MFIIINILKGLHMDARLEAISDACREINRNLFLLQGDYRDAEMVEALDSAAIAINQFESEQMHAIRVLLEGRDR